AVGGYREDSAATGTAGDGQSDESLDEAGAVYLFVRDDSGAWAQDAYLKASNPGEGDRFGRSLALSGDGSTLAVRANNEDSAATGADDDGQRDESATDDGAVYVY